MRKQDIINEMDAMRGKSPIADRALDYIASIDDTAMWADYIGRSDDARATLIVMLKHLGGSGLRIKGFEHADIAMMDQATGTINTGHVTVD